MNAIASILCFEMNSAFDPWQVRLRRALDPQELQQKEELAARLAKAEPPPPDLREEREALHKELMAQSAAAAAKAQAQTQANLQAQAHEEARQKQERAAELVTLADMIGDRIAERILSAIRKEESK